MLREIANDFYMNQNYNCGECILRAAKIFLHLSSSLCIAAAHDLLRSAANQTRIFDAQTLIPRKKRYTSRKIGRMIGLRLVVS